MGLSPAARSAVSEAKAGRGQRLSPDVSAELSNQPTPGSSAASSPPPAIALPDFSSFSIPGSTPLIKAVVVLGVLLLGIAFYSKVTGQPMALSLQGFNPGRPAQPNPSTLAPGFAQTVPTTIAGGVNTMAPRIAAVNPSKVA